MKKSYRLYALVVFLFAQLLLGTVSQAQSVVQIGIGNDIPANTLYSPIYRFSATSTTNGCRSNIMFTQAEMNAAGIATGDFITALAFNKTNQAHFTNNVTLNMLVANSTKTGLTTADTWAAIQASHTQVYTNTAFDVQDAAGWFTFTFATPFTYTGGTLEVATEHTLTNPGTGSTDALKWEYTASVPTNYIVANATATGAILNSTVAGYKFRPNTRITFTPSGPCTSPPTPGTATASPTTSCATAPVTLNATGVSTGTGQTYIWQSSPTLGGTYTDVTVSSSSTTATVNPSTTSYYRLAVTCSGNTAYSTPVLVTVTPAFAAGTYTINSAVATGGTNFQSFTAVVNALACGISGPVVFNVDATSGPYTEQITIPSIIGSSPVNTITFNGNGRTLQFAPVTANRHIIKLDGAQYVKFDNLVIKSTDITYGWGVHLINAANNNTITNSTIDVSSVVSTTTSNYGGIFATASTTSATSVGDNASNLTATNNIIIGGGYAISINGSAAIKSRDNNISNNVIKDFYSYGVRLSQASNNTVANNDINRANRNDVTTFYGIDLEAGCEAMIIDANRIHDTHTTAGPQSGSAYGIEVVSADAAAGSENKITNNLLYNFNSVTGLIYGLYNSSSDGCYFYHNTVVLNGNTASSGTTRGFYQLTTATNIELKNNIIIVGRSGLGAKHVFYFGAATSAIISDNNLLRMTSNDGPTNNIGYLSGGTPVENPTLANWQTASGQDAASINLDPVFMNEAAGNFRPTNAAVNNKGTYVNVDFDILGAPRDPSTPDLGAYEFDVTGCSAPPTAGTTTSDATGTICPNTTVNFGLTGNTIGTGQTYQLQTSSTLGGTYTDVGTAQTSTSLNVAPTVSGYYRIAVTCTGMTDYSTPIFVSVAALFSGTFTINSALPTAGSNYQTFADAIAAMSCGIAGPVIFNVDAASGPYTEQVVIPVIAGASAANTISFNGNGRTLQFAPVSANRSIIKLDGADYVKFDNLNIISSDATYGWGVWLINGADNNTITNCTINMDAVTSTTQSNSAGITFSNSATSVLSGGNNGNNNTISNNTISGAYQGVILYGGSITVLADNKVLNNTIRDFYSYGVYCLYNDGIIISDNDIQRQNRVTVSSFYGIYLSTNNQNSVINANRIHDTHNSASSVTGLAYGIYFSSSDATAGRENKVTNNLIYNFNNLGGGATGIYNSSSDYAQYYHNTIVLDDAAATTTSATYGFYQVTSAVGLEYKNNIVKIARGGGGNRYALYFGATGTASTIVSDYNDLLNSSTGAGIIATGYLALPTPAASYTTLTDWQATGFDANSVSIEPNFVNPAAGNYTPQTAALDNKGISVGVATDIIGVTRGATPDIGAYEFTVPVCTSPPTAGTTTTDITGVSCANTTVNISLSGNSIGLTQTYQLQSASTLAGTYSNIGTSQNTFIFTANPVVTTYYRVAVTCGGNTTFSTPVEVMIAALFPGGTYSINSAAPTGGSNFQTFTAAADAIKCGIAGPVIFNVDAASGPYTEQVSFADVFNTSTSNTITINGNGRTLQAAPIAAARYVLQLNGTDYVTVDNLKIVSTDLVYGWGIHLTNNADNNTISNCDINVSAVTSTTASYSGGIVSSGSNTSTSVGRLSGASRLNASSLSILNNTITGGYQAITLYGLAASKTTGVTVSNNTLQGFYATGIDLNYMDNAVISYNNISRATSTAVTTFTGIDLGTGNEGVLVTANRIHDTHNSATTQSGTAYGITVSSDAPVGFENKITNNLIYNFNSLSGTQYGLYSSGGDNVMFYHNTVVLDNSASTSGITRGFYQLSTAVGIDFQNNLVVIGRGGSGAKHAIYLGTSASTVTSNYNDLLMLSNTGTTNSIGYVTGATPADKPTLADLQAAGYDAQSVSIFPNFSDPATGNYKPNSAALDNKGTNLGVTIDILNVTRNAATPDVGAYEFTGTVVPVKLLAISASSQKVDALVIWETTNEINSSHYEVERSSDGNAFVFAGQVISNNSLGNNKYSFNDVNAIAYARAGVVYYRLKMVDKDGRFSYSNVVSVKFDNKSFVELTAYPNPFKEKLGLRIITGENQNAAVTVMDVTGKIVARAKYSLVAGNNLIEIAGAEKWASGIYLSKVTINNIPYTIKLVKE